MHTPWTIQLAKAVRGPRVLPAPRESWNREDLLHAANLLGLGGVVLEFSVHSLDFILNTLNRLEVLHSLYLQLYDSE